MQVGATIAVMLDLLVYAPAAVLIAWGAAHIANTSPVVDSFGEIGVANRRILKMEWIAEGLMHIAIGLLAVLVAALEESGSSTAHLLYRALAGVLLVLAGLTAATGSRTPVIWFKVCPFLLTGAAALLLIRTLL